MANFSAEFQGRVGGKDIEQVVQRFNNVYPSRQTLREVGEMMVQSIRERTASGIDSDDIPFEPYAEKYASQKGSSNVDLRSIKEQEHMMDNLQFRVYPRQETQSSIAVGFFDDEDIITRARINNDGAEIRVRRVRKMGRKRKATFTIPRRHFLGVDKETMDVAGQMIVSSMIKNLKGE
jgi:hypothetical protein